jgi:hypothetical protein
MEGVHGVLTTIALLAECTPTWVSENPKWTVIVQNKVGTRRNLHQLLEGKLLYSVLCGVYKKVQQNLTAVLRQHHQRGNSKAKIFAAPSIKEFCEQRRQKQKYINNADKRIKESTTSTTEANNPKCSRSLKFPPWTSSPYSGGKQTT